MRIFRLALLGLLLLEACGSGAKGGGGAGGSGAGKDATPEAPPADAGIPVTPPFLVDLALNDGTSARAPRGWPLLLTGVAALWDEGAAPVALTAASVTVSDASHQAQAWPLTQATTPAPVAALDADHDSAEVDWVLTPAQTGALAVGTYQVQLTWAGQVSAPLALEIVEAPTGLAPPAAAREQARLATLTARVALLQSDPAAALVALNAALVDQPTHAGLLSTKALAHEAAGAKKEALQSAEAALEQVLLNKPTEPVSTRELRNRLRAASAGGAP